MGVNDEHFEKRFRRQQCELYYELYCSILRVLLDHFTIENVFVSSIHSITDSQNLLDNSGRDLRRARSAMEKMSFPPQRDPSPPLVLFFLNFTEKLMDLRFVFPFYGFSVWYAPRISRRNQCGRNKWALREASQTPRFQKDYRYLWWTASSQQIFEPIPIRLFSIPNSQKLWEENMRKYNSGTIMNGDMQHVSSIFWKKWNKG